MQVKEMSFDGAGAISTIVVVGFKHLSVPEIII